ncbi:MAG: hypothetical protein AB7P23_02195 [Amphiplicatus sp.]
MDKFRIAVLAEKDARFAPWERKLFAALSADERFELVLLSIVKTTTPRVKGHFFFRTLMRAEAMLFARVPFVEASPFGPDHTINAEQRTTLSATAEHEGEEFYDVILNHASGPVPANLAKAAKYGVWSMDFALSPDARALAGFWEADKKANETRAALVVHSADGAPAEIIADAGFNTKFCASRNAAFIRDKSVPLILRELRRLAGGLPAAPRRPFAAPAPRYPGALTLIDYAVGVARGLASRLAALAAARVGARPGMWFLRSGGGEPLALEPSTGADIIPYGNQFWADPFLIRENGADYVFFEDYDYSASRGAIAVGKFEDGAFAYLGKAIEAPYHFSFPFLFRHEGELFMMPETVEKERIEIWRCVEFPLRWTLHKTAFEGVLAADSVTFERAGAWWLFTNVSTDAFGDHCSDLHLYRVDGPMLDNPVAHPLNPVVMDSAVGRNGGRVFEKNGKLYRVSQNNAFGAYGYGVNLMEIESLSLDDYRERAVRRIAPDFAEGLIGCHHLDAVGDGVSARWVLDARKRSGGFPPRSRSTRAG